MPQIDRRQLTVTTKALYSLLAFVVVVAAEGAQEPDADRPAVDKAGFNLFNSTPAKYLREMDTDGPGATESPYTVDAGHFQFEMAFVAYTADRESFGGVTHRLDAWAIGPITLKVGLLNQLDAQVLLEPYNLVYERAGASRITRRGFGDTTVRLKYNLWGNDGGRTALAAMPYVKFPTSAEGLGNNGIEGGLILPLAVALPAEFFMGLTTRFDAARDEGAGGYHAEFMNSVALGHDLFRKVFGYIEFFSVVSTERDTGWVGTFDMGLIYSLTRNIQLSAGVNIGLTDSAEDWNPFLGLAWRF